MCQALCASFALCHLIGPQPPHNAGIYFYVIISEMRKLGLEEILLVA